MKKTLLISLCCSVLVLTGCNISSVSPRMQSRVDTLVKKDQQQEQWFELTSQQIYAAYDGATKRLNLSHNALRAVPDICALMKIADHDQVRYLDLSHNDIRILNTDLTCLRYLKSLDLSHNDVQAVQTLGTLAALQELNLEHNELATTANLPDAPLLEKLYLAYNKIKEVENMDHLKNLIVLELQNNLIERLEGIEQLQQLKELKMDFDKIKAGDLSPILERLEETELVDELGNVITDAIKKKLFGDLPFG